MMRVGRVKDREHADEKEHIMSCHLLDDDV